jgi:hypothetical protein
MRSEMNIFTWEKAGLPFVREEIVDPNGRSQN